MVVLLHKVETWDTVSVLYPFSKFSKIQLFKPPFYHASRSSFYMVATNIQSKHLDAIALVEDRKRLWEVATFGTDDEYDRALHESESKARAVLDEFGPRLIELGRDIWVTQARGLQRSCWFNKGGNNASARHVGVVGWWSRLDSERGACM